MTVRTAKAGLLFLAAFDREHHLSGILQNLIKLAMSSRSNQQPHNRNKPAFSEKQTIELVERIFGLKVAELKPLPSYDDQNFHVRVPKLEGTGDYAEEYVVKIINGEDSQNPGLIEVQTEIMMFLNKEGFPVPAPRSTKGGEIMFLESVDADSSTQGYLVRLLTYLPGKTVATIPMSPPVLYEIGQLAAKLDQTIAEKFRHPLIGCLHRGEFIWNLANVPLLERYIYALGQSEYLEVVKQIIEQFKDRIVPKLSTFRPCINHGDLNDHNILLDTDSVSSPSSHYRVSGILDFSDMSYGCYVFEIAITIMYMMIESKDPLRAGGHILAGFESIVPLMTEERDALFLLVCGRFAQSLVMAAHTTLLHPENEEYLMITARTGWKHLMKLFEMGQEAVEKIWFETAGTYT